MIRILERETMIRKPRNEVFSFFLEAENLEKLTPPWLKFRVSEASSLPLKDGTVIHYRLRLLGLPIRWISRITDFNAPEQFTDIQLKGPYSLWIHTHTFLSEGNATRMIDRVEYKVPGRIFEPLIHFLFVKKQLFRIFEYRTEKIRKIFGETEKNLKQPD